MDKKELRNYLGKVLHDNFKTDPLPILLERQKELERQIEKAKNYDAAIRLAREIGWEWHDISEVVKYDKQYIGFVGTLEELEENFPELKNS